MRGPNGACANETASMAVIKGCCQAGNRLEAAHITRGAALDDAMDLSGMHQGDPGPRFPMLPDHRGPRPPDLRAPAIPNSTPRRPTRHWANKTLGQQDTGSARHWVSKALGQQGTGTADFSRRESANRGAGPVTCGALALGPTEVGGPAQGLPVGATEVGGKFGAAAGSPLNLRELPTPRPCPNIPTNSGFQLHDWI
jgi:hypothetical protein